MLIVALTGGIACGKSVVAASLRDMGCFVHSADLIARDLMNPDSPAWKEIVARFGSGILNPDRTIDRAKLGAIIFADRAERSVLDGIVHPRVQKKLEDVIADLEREGRYSIYVLEAALVLEAGMTGRYDKIIVTHCAEEVRILRLMERDGIGREAALRKIHSQASQEEKLRQADYPIDTSGTIAETIEQTERIYAMLVRDEELKTAARDS